MRAQAIKLLASIQPSESQRQWLMAQMQSSQQLTAPNPDHPEQQMVIINIAGSAKATYQHCKLLRLLSNLASKFKWAAGCGMTI